MPTDKACGAAERHHGVWARVVATPPGDTWEAPASGKGLTLGSLLPGSFPEDARGSVCSALETPEENPAPLPVAGNRWLCVWEPTALALATSLALGDKAKASL